MESLFLLNLETLKVSIYHFVLEKMSSKKKEKERVTEIRATKYLLEQIRELQLQVESLKSELKSMKHIPSGKIGIGFLIPGISLLIFSIVKESQILAFIGLGLTFWGALFLFIKPVRYVKSELLHSTSLSSYLTIDRIINSLKFEGKGYYIPPYPKDIYLPEYLKGLKEMAVFISADTGSSMPSIDEMAKSKFMLKNPNGICISPPGLGLLIQFEKELGMDLTRMELDDLLETLPQLVTENIHLAKQVEIKKEDGKIRLRIFNSVYRDLYVKEGLKSIHLLGCPLVSAVACAIAKSSGKAVTIERDGMSLDEQLIEVWYNFAGD